MCGMRSNGASSTTFGSIMSMRQLIRRPPEEERREHDVEADRFTGAGRAGDDHVRHAREVGVDGIANDVATEDDRQRHVEGLEAAILDEIAEVHRHVRFSFGSSKPIRFLPRDRRDDADLLREGEREIVRERRRPSLTFVPAAGGHLEGRDDGARAGSPRPFR